LKIYRQLELKDRDVIQKKSDQGHRPKYIADILGFHISTIYRELNRNSLQTIGYISHFAQLKTNERRATSCPRPAMDNTGLLGYVGEKLKLQWSPDQIAHRIEIAYPKDLSMRISHETIYQYIWSNKKAGGDLYKYLRQSNKKVQKVLKIGVKLRTGK